MNVHSALKNQYHAALAMLREAIVRCPDSLWDTPKDGNRYWHVAYHVLFYTDLYLEPNEATYVRWKDHRANAEFMGPGPGPQPRPRLEPPYSRESMLEYWRHCDGKVDAAVDALDLSSPESGFWWYPITKLEHQIVNVRHVQHHAGQLIDRLRMATGQGVEWEG